MKYDDLKVLPREQLVDAALKMGIRVHHKAKPETIAKQIMENSLNKPQPKKQEEVDPYADPRLVSKPATYNTIAQVEKAVAQMKVEQPAFKTTYFDEYDDEVDGNDEESAASARTVKFECLGAVETINLSTPLRWIRERAMIAKRGRIAPISLHGHFEKGVSTGNNSYTNVVLNG